MIAQLIIDIDSWNPNTHNVFAAPWMRTGSWCILLQKTPINVEEYSSKRRYYQQVCVLSGQIMEFTHSESAPIHYYIQMKTHPHKTLGSDGYILFEDYYNKATTQYTHAVNAMLTQLRTSFHISHALLVDSEIASYKPT